MTPSEFKAWFQGFTEALAERPSDEQWKRIKARVAEIDGHPITERIYVDRYLPYYGTMPVYRGGWVPHPPYVYCASGGVGTAVGTGNSFSLNTVTGTGQQTTSFDSRGAMLALGRAEAQGLNS